jgi:hypothetical protein
MMVRQSLLPQTTLCRLLACSGDLPAAVALGHPKTLTAKSRFLAVKQKADNAGGNEEENSPDHHTAHSAEQHDDEVGLTKQHPKRHSADKAANDAGDRETLGKPDVTSLTHVCCSVARGDRAALAW